MSAERSSGFRRATNLIAAVGWPALFSYSLYVLLDKIFSSSEYTVFHLIAPLVLALVSVKAIRRARACN